MSEILRIIEEYKDAHGQPADAAVARALGLSPQALNSLKRRGGLHSLQGDQYSWLGQLAIITHLPYQYVLDCALYDIGLLLEKPRRPGTDQARERGAS